MSTGAPGTELRLPTLADIQVASERIGPYIWQTPCLKIALDRSASLVLKMECWQRTGSFKLRGALNKVLSLDKASLRAGLVTASAGNHGLGVVEAARRLRAFCTVFVPESASSAKTSALKRGNADVKVVGTDYDECEAAALEWAKQKGRTFIHAFDDPEVIAGQGTLALELLASGHPFETLFVPVGGGGLISGMAVALKALRPQVRVVGVQPEACPAMVRSLEAGRVVETPFTGTLADGLAGRFVSERTLFACQKFVDEVTLVSESAIRKALRWFVDTTHTIAEASAVVGIAAALQLDARTPLATVVTGRNIDTGLLLQVLQGGRN